MSFLLITTSGINNVNAIIDTIVAELDLQLLVFILFKFANACDAILWTVSRSVASFNFDSKSLRIWFTFSWFSYYIFTFNTFIYFFFSIFFAISRAALACSLAVFILLISSLASLIISTDLVKSYEFSTIFSFAFLLYLQLHLHLFLNIHYSLHHMATKLLQSSYDQFYLEKILHHNQYLYR